jgi:hypothetical protein
MFNQIEPSSMMDENGGDDSRSFLGNKKVLIFIGVFLLAVIVGATLLFVNKNKPKPEVTPQIIETVKEVTSTTVTLLPISGTSTNIMASTTVVSGLENYSFSAFYQEPDLIPEFKFKDYTLPLNVKIDVLNYYDISRKLNLDDGLASLNANGFTILNNPAERENSNFYAAYSYLSSKEVPLLVTSDFLLHYHQNVIKQVFKDIEEKIFYDNLLRISTSLYESSKNRYEARLAKIGNVNDQVLEGERLSMAYFAVALKLLEPSTSQIDTTGKDANKFTSKEAAALNFTILPYLQSDAGEEIKLIRTADGNKKSPVLLYNRNYADFVVPSEYRRTEKLYNFYLASTWLNSVFPLVVKDKNCPTCLLDKEDARLSLIASTFITKDFSADQEIKNRWALVYKLVSYYKGLRNDLTYRNYDDEMKTLFGPDYDPEFIFAESNKEANANIEKLRAKLLTLQFNDFQGALNKNTEKQRLGFKILSDYYLSNDYVFNRLSGDEVGVYNGEKASSSNLTICKGNLKRCNGFGLDIIGLITDKLNAYEYWVENTNFLNYNDKLLALKNELKLLSIWQNNNYWSILSSIKMVFENNNSQMQVYSQTESWRKRLVDTAAAAWTDLQMPLEKLTPVGAPTKKGLSTDSFDNNFYVEPNYALIQRLIADNEMIYGMFDAMSINKQVDSVSSALKEENVNLRQFSDLIKKELNGETLSSDDQIFINLLVKKYQVDQTPNNRLFLKIGTDHLYEDLGVKFLAIVYESGEGKYIAIGPIFSYQESR